MWNLSLPWWEFVVRGIIVYLFVLVLLRLTGKRQIGQLAPFDLVLLLILSNAVQNAMNGGDNSILGGIISAVTLVGTNYLVGWLTYKSKKIEHIIEGRPQVLVHNGVLYHDIMAKEQITQHELESSMRQAGCADIRHVHFAVLENDGHISIKIRSS